MVGVGGRSKACENCRRRRVKCGKKYIVRTILRLLRNICIDLARPCCLRCQKARLLCSGPRGISIVHYSGPKDTARFPACPVDNDVDSQMVQASVQHILKPLTVPHDDMYQAFTQAHLLSGVEAISVDPGIDRVITGKCFLALSTAYFGIKHHEKTVFTRGLSRYSIALQTVHDALRDEGASRSFDLLEAVMIMQVIEVTDKPESKLLMLTKVVPGL